MVNKDYTLSRSEYAKSLGISVDTLKKRMKRNRNQFDYITVQNEYRFKPQEQVRDITVKSLGTLSPVKRKINRGNHYNAKYPNAKFKEYNQQKMLAKINETDPDFLREYQQLKQLHKQQKAERILADDKKASSVFKNYGGLYNPSKVQHPNWKDFEEEAKKAEARNKRYEYYW
jgi:hypothetical protein|tara:strand:- start:226 stop:744 length:519 start_codon:yes stop_codon:yes gene_type:complete